MKSLKDDYGYNQRLFSGGLRGRLHLARFHWLAGELARRGLPAATVLELGCFDGKLIDFFPIKPARYVGFDANWEGGLDLAREKWAQTPAYTFFKSTTPEEMALDDDDVFDIGVVMETLEHIPPQLVDGYLEKMARHLDGYFFATVPNEKGIVFLSKWLVKKLLSRDAAPYSFAELINATLGRMTHVSRREHKGFDYDALIVEIKKHFDVIEVAGIPAGFLPPFFSFGVGILAKSRRRTREA